MSNYSDSIYQQDQNTSWYKINKLIMPGSKLLDIGCSSGNFGKVLINEKKCIVDGIELDKGDYEKAKKNLRNVYNINVENDDLSVIDDKYDYIYFGDVIEHLVSPVKSLKRIKHLLNNNGGILFSIPNMAHISVRLMLLRGSFSYGETGLLDKTHLHYYDLDEVYRIFQDAGFFINNLDYVKRDLPKETLKYELGKIGLKANEQFINDSKKVEASAYQFVGLAVQSGKKRTIKPMSKISPRIDEMEKHFKHLNTVHNAQIRAHQKRIKQLEKIIQNQNITIAELSNRNLIDRIFNR